MWVYHSVRFAVTGELPAGSVLVEPDTVVHLGFVLDLALLVPAYALAAVLLWRRSGWGGVTAALVLICGTVQQLAYVVALPFQVAADVPGARAFDPGEPLIALAFLLATVALVTGLRHSVRPTTPPKRTQPLQASKRRDDPPARSNGGAATRGDDRVGRTCARPFGERVVSGCWALRPRWLQPVLSFAVLEPSHGSCRPGSSPTSDTAQRPARPDQARRAPADVAV